ncbi:MAG: gamma-glutamylcyclotransferase family protein [Dehalococcoidia bacterium]
MGDQLYFAYGSNMDEQQMRNRCPGAVRGGKARLRDYEFRINKRRKATIVPSPGQNTWGVLWNITASHERALDCYEGVKSETYRKKTVEVFLTSGTKERALTYIASDCSVGSPEPDYMERILRGAKEADLPPDYIKVLHEWKKLAS